MFVRVKGFYIRSLVYQESKNNLENDSVLLDSRIRCRFRREKKGTVKGFVKYPTRCGTLKGAAKNVCGYNDLPIRQLTQIKGVKNVSEISKTVSSVSRTST